MAQRGRPPKIVDAIKPSGDLDVYLPQPIVEAAPLIVQVCIHFGLELADVTEWEAAGDRLSIKAKGVFRQCLRSDL